MASLSVPSDPSGLLFFLPLCVWNSLRRRLEDVSWALLCASPGVPPSRASPQVPFTCIHAAHVVYLPILIYVSIILTQMLLPGPGTPPQELCSLSSFHSVPSTLHPSRLHLATYQMKKKRGHGAVRQVLNP